MDLNLITRVTAGGLAVGSAVACAAGLSRLPVTANRPLPIASILLIGITILITALQFPFPEILAAFRRNPEALKAGEWWRMVTPLFVQPDGWMQCLGNGTTALIFCPLVEKLYGKRMLALYFIPGVAGEIVAYMQNSHGAGSSLGIGGVMGALFGFALMHRLKGLRFRIILAITGLCGAITLTLCGDRHGPPILVGVALGCIMKPEIRSAPDKPSPVIAAHQERLNLE